MTEPNMMRLKNHSEEAGMALIGAVLVVAVVAGMTSAFLAIGVSGGREISAVLDDTRAFYLAEAGINEALVDVRMKLDSEQTIGLNLGDRQSPRKMRSGEYWVTLTDQGDDIYTMDSIGRSGSSERSIAIVVEAEASGAFDNALFSGNSSNDPNYVMEFGGSGAEADIINGDVYSGGAIEVTGDAAYSGEARAMTWITGGTATIGRQQKLPDVFSMNYQANHDVDVAAQFANGSATYQSDEAGGTAWQLPESEPSHIFRLNPSDRTNVTAGTTKDDYFLEDPYEPVKRDANSDGTDASPISLSGLAGTPGQDSSNYVFYIDGNFWLHNGPTFSFQFIHDLGEEVRVTFVVRGNVYFADNLFYQDHATDAVAFIAIKDPNVADSGNIYFGDPIGGTIEYMSAFMYAENNFIDYNLSASGSKQVEVWGSMSAGNHVNIDRDYAGHHSRLTVGFDDRLSTGAIQMPGMPTAISNAGGLNILAWTDKGDH